ncbi:hypothetical protein OG900_33035 [Streptomyces sp. NBC_00433]
MSHYSPVPVVSLDRFEGKDYVALEAPQLLDAVLLTPEQARVLAAALVAHADALDPPA